MGIKSIKVKKKVIIISLIAVSVVGIGISSYVKAKKAKVKQVTMAKVSKKNITKTVSATGSIEAKFRSDIALNPAQKVVKVLVAEGQQVKKGDILIQLDASDFQSQLDKQKINLSNAQATLRQLSGASLENDRANAENSISQAQITLEKSQRNYDDLKKKFDQNKELLAKGYISQNDYDAAKKQLDDAENSIKDAELVISNSQNSLSKVNSTNNDKITDQKNQIAMIQADIDKLNKNIQDCNIIANTDGKVIKVDAKENQFPKAGDMLIVDDSSQYIVSIDMSQYDAVKVAKDQKANIKVKGQTKKYTGVVTEVGQMAQIKVNGTDQEHKVNVKIVMDNPDEDIKAGYEADAEIVLSQKPNIIAMGFDGIKDEKGTSKKYVYAVDSKNKVVKKYIKTGIESDYDIEVTDGLKDGDKYILNPSDTLHEGDQVAEAAAAGKNGGSKK